MPSSTSSSERRVPEGAWLRAALAALLIALLGTAGWEVHWRSQGYAPTLNDTGTLWASVRAHLQDDDRDQIAIVGSSRVLFDLDLGQIAEHFGTDTPLQLALPGAAPLPVLEHLAHETEFGGTVLVGMVPPLYFVPAGFPVERAETAIRAYRNLSPSQRLSHELGIRLQEHVAFLNQEDLALEYLLRRLDVPNRAEAQKNIPPRFPPYFGLVDRDRQVWMWEACDFGTPLATMIQNIWKPLFTPPPPPPGVTPEQAKEGYMAAMEGTLERTRAAVDAIRSRGGNVVFLRCPSTGWVREIENETAPRPGFWDRTLAVTGAPGIHFEDHPGLAGYDCPEWSHLTAEDAREFTARLLPILEATLESARAADANS